MKRYWLFLGLLLLAAGCPPGNSQRSAQQYYPSYSDVPPQFYENDPSLRQWYTYPYWNPEAGVGD